jgi:hypothetical protein
VIGCTGKPHDAARHESLSVTNEVNDADMFKLYDPSSLIEVRKFSDLPDGVKVLANRDGMEAKGEGPEGRLREFMVGGASQTSALVAYEQFGYTPTYFAAAYVYTGGKWVAVRRWEIGKVTTLKEALNIIGLSSK